MAEQFAFNRMQNCKKRHDDDDAFNHVLRTAKTLERMGYEEDIVAAAFLHDLIEDTETTEQEILERFGEEVTRIVMGVTHDNSLKGKAKKQDLLLKVEATGKKAIVVKLADNCDNLRTIEYFKLWKVADYLDFATKVQEMGKNTLGEKNELVCFHAERLARAREKSAKMAKDILQKGLVSPIL